MKVNHKDDENQPSIIVDDAQLNYLPVPVTKLFNAVNSVKKIMFPQIYLKQYAI